MKIPNFLILLDHLKWKIRHELGANKNGGIISSSITDWRRAIYPRYLMQTKISGVFGEQYNNGEQQTR